MGVTIVTTDATEAPIGHRAVMRTPMRTESDARTTDSKSPALLQSTR